MKIDIHDFEIIGLNFDRTKGTLRLELISDYADTGYFLYFHEVNNFFIEGFKRQNVILDFICIDATSASDYIDYCLNKLEIESVENLNGAKIFYIEPSIGLEVICLCHRFEITPIERMVSSSC